MAIRIKLPYFGNKEEKVIKNNENFKFYEGWDVHSWTNKIKEDIMLYFNETEIEHFKLALNTQLFDIIWVNILHLFPNLLPILKKFKTRSTDKNNEISYNDSQIFNINILQILYLVFNEIKDNCNFYSLFNEILTDCAQTCVQGDSHRLIWLYITILRSKQE